MRISPGLTVIENDELKNFGSPIRPRRTRSDHAQVDLLEVQPIRNHQADAMAAAGRDHPSALLDGDRHRLLAEHVHAGACGADRVLGVHRVRQRDVDGVHLLEAGIVVVVSERVFDAVRAGQLLQLGAVVADERREPRVAPRVREGRQHRHLRDMAEANHRIADAALSVLRHPLPLLGGFAGRLSRGLP